VLHTLLLGTAPHSAILQLMHKDYLNTYPPLFITMYSFIQLSEPE